MNGFTAELEAHREALLELEHAASRAYDDFVYRDSEQSLRIRSFLLDKGVAEFGPPFAQLLVEGGRVLGLVACLSAADLAKARMRSAYALARASFYEEDPQLFGRMQAAGEALIRPSNGDFYLSRIAVAPDAAGSGTGARLLEECERQARAAGCRRVVLEVAGGNKRARDFYLRHSFSAHGAWEVNGGADGARLIYEHFGKRLD